MINANDLVLFLQDKGHDVQLMDNAIRIDQNVFIIYTQFHIYSDNSWNLINNIRDIRFSSGKGTDYILIGAGLAFAFTLADNIIYDEEFYFADRNEAELYTNYLNPDICENFFDVGKYVNLLEMLAA